MPAIGAASVAVKGLSLSIVLGVILLALVLVSIALAKVTRKISTIVFITTLGVDISRPWFFGAKELNAAVKTVDFLSIATVMLALSGFSLGRDIPLLTNIGWKIMPAGLLSTVIAEFALGLWHCIGLRLIHAAALAAKLSGRRRVGTRRRQLRVASMPRGQAEAGHVVGGKVIHGGIKHFR